jgi:hypothetical protein
LTVVRRDVPTIDPRDERAIKTAASTKAATTHRQCNHPRATATATTKTTKTTTTTTSIHISSRAVRTNEIWYVLFVVNNNSNNNSNNNDNDNNNQSAATTTTAPTATTTTVTALTLGNNTLYCQNAVA